MRRYPGEAMSRYTVAEAADILGITTGAVRNRLSRGTLRSTKFAGTVYVLLPDDMLRSTERDAKDTPGGIPPYESDALISSKDETIAVLREQLEAERQAHAEARRLLMAALERIPAIEPPQEATEDAETVEEEPEPSEPRHDAAGPQAGVESAPGTPEERDEEAVQQEGPQPSEAMGGASDDWPLADSREQSTEAEAVVLGPVEEQHRAAQEPETAEIHIASGEVQQEHPDDMPSDEQEEAAEGSGSVEDEESRKTDEEVDFEERRERFRREREALERRIEERRAAAEEAARRRRSPWWRRFLGQ